MSFYLFKMSAQRVIVKFATMGFEDPKTVASALAQANLSGPFYFWPPQATTPRDNLRTYTKLLLISR